MALTHAPAIPRHVAIVMDGNGRWAKKRFMPRVFGHKPRYSLDDGLGRMAAWVRKVGARQSQAFGALDIEKNLPPSWRV